jgi:hypothetical protein
MPEVTPSKYLVMAGWDHAPHLSEKTKRELLASTPAHLRDARSKGIPALGSGAIFPVAEEQIRVSPFPIPPHWPQINGLDFGWTHPTAAASIAWDRDADCIYVTKVYRRSEAPPVIHAAAVKAWGDWIPVAWPHDGNNDTAAGEALARQYKQHGLPMLNEHATHEAGGNSVEAGLMEMLDRMETGRWKVFSTCDQWFEEYRLYHRKDGKIVKVIDDTLSASRYAYMMRRKAIVKPRKSQPAAGFEPLNSSFGY